jgi:TM2 domain-containing membrane protein YozV
MAASLCSNCGYQFASVSGVVAPTTVIHNIITNAPVQPSSVIVVGNRRSKSTAILWAFLLGGIGGHKFYLGQSGWGVAYLLLCWTWIPLVVAVCEIVWLLVMGEQEFDQKFNASHVKV